MTDSNRIVVSDKVHAEMQRGEGAGLVNARDRIAQAYLGQWGSRETVERARNRVHWLGRQVRGRRVLDIGCSEGILAVLLAREGFDVTGVDVNADAIAFAEQLLGQEAEEVRRRVRFICANIATLEPTQERFDSVLIGEVIEHVLNPAAFLEKCLRHLKPGGTCVLTTPFGILPSIDHKQTYVASDLVRLLSPHLEISHLSIADGYLRAVGTARGNGVAPTAPGAGDAEAGQPTNGAGTELARPDFVHALLTETERALLDAQRALWGRIATLRENAEKRIEKEVAAQTKSLRRELADAKAAHQREVGQLQQEYTRAVDEVRHTAVRNSQAVQTQRQDAEQQAAKLKQTVKKLTERMKQAEADALARERELARVRGQITRQKDQLQYAQAQHELQRREVRYRVGDALVGSYYHPGRVFGLPALLVRLYREGVQRRAQRAHEEDLELQSLSGATSATAQATVVSKAPPRSVKPAARATTAPTAPPAEAAPTAVRHFAPGAATRAGVEALEKPQETAATIDVQRTDTLVFTPPTRATTAPRLPLHVATIMDEFTYECFRDECRLTPVGVQDWKAQLTQDRPQLLLVESTWRGNGGQWKLQYEKCDPLRELTAWCKARQIPTVFWNKEDPPNFERFIHSAGTCDCVFTSDEQCVPKYRERLGHDRVASMAFAAQPTIHNPIDSLAPRLGNLCFAGTYYRVKYPQRQRDLDILLRPALSRGLTIFDRKHGYTESNYYQFPDEYKGVIRGGLSYGEMLAAYKAYHIFLNVNSVRESPTMFSRRVLELLACGTAVISAPAVGMERLLGRDAVAIVDSEEESAEWMDRLINDPELRRRMVIRGQRRVFNEHTYEHRMGQILDAVGITRPQVPRRVSVVTVTNRPGMLQNAIENYTRQAYAGKEWIIVLNSSDFSLPQVREQVAHIPNVQVFEKPEAWTLGACLNFALDQMQYEYFAKFDDDDYYAEHYLTDQMNAFKYSDTHIVGKRSYLAHLTGSGQLALRFPGHEHRYCSLVAGATLVVRRELFKEQRFREDVERGVDTCFERACVNEAGHAIYSTDRYNFVARRAAESGHTWSISDQEFLERCALLPAGTDPRTYATV